MKKRICGTTLMFLVGGLLSITACAAEEGQTGQSRLSKLNPITKAKAAKEKITKTLKPPDPATPIRDKWAMIVALESFQDNSIRPVKYAQENALILSSYCASPEAGKFGPSRVVIVTNNKASKRNVEKALGESWLLKNALPNDLVVLYFCTRGQMKADGSDLLLYMFDANPSQPEQGTVELKALLKNLKQRIQSKQILCLLDVNPVVIKKEGETEDTSAKTPALPANSVTLQQIAAETGCTIFSAADIGQRTYPAFNNKCSYFMENIMEALALKSGEVQFDEVAQAVKQAVAAKVAADLKKQQTPVLAMSEDANPMLKTVIGSAVKSSTPDKLPKIGHPQDDVPGKAINIEPEIKVVKVNSKTPSTIKEEESYDDNASFGNVDFGPYMDKMKRDIQAQWNPPKGFNNQRVVTVFSIKKDGTIANASIVDGSGVEAVDKSAMDALEKASPLDPLPSGSPPYVQMKYQFDWTVKKN